MPASPASETHLMPDYNLGVPLRHRASLQLDRDVAEARAELLSGRIQAALDAERQVADAIVNGSARDALNGLDRLRGVLTGVPLKPAVILSIAAE